MQPNASEPDEASTPPACIGIVSILAEFDDLSTCAALRCDAAARCANETDNRAVTVLALEAEHLTVVLHAAIEHLACLLSEEVAA